MKKGEDNKRAFRLNLIVILFILVLVFVIFSAAGRINFVGRAVTGPPSAFNLISPETNSIQVSLTPTLTWQKSTNAKSYILQISRDTSFSVILYQARNIRIRGSDLTGSYTIPSGVLSSNSLYYWKVIAVNSYGNVVASNAPFSFSTLTNIDTDPPTVSVTHSPTNPDNTQQVTYTATASDLSGISEIKIYVDNVNVQTCYSATTCSFNAGPYSSGSTHTYYATATDNSQNSNSGRDPLTGTKSLTVVSSGGGGQQYPMWITAYYAGWMSSYLPPSAIDYNAVTHIIHFALWPQSNGGLDCAGNTVCPGPTTTALINNAHAAGKKVLIGVGGWASDSNFRSATAGSCTTSGTGNTCYTFINNLVNFMQTNGYDGIDIDWEPMGSGDATRFTNFITALRARLNTINPRPLLTAATAWEFPLFSQLQNNFDQINIMTYDMSGPYQGWVTWHNSPLYNGGYTFPSTNGPVPSVDNEVNSMISTGVSRNKIGIGVDFYGYEWRGGSTFYENGNAAGGAFEPKLCWQSTGNPSRPCGNGQAPTQSFNIAYYDLANTYGIIEYDYSHPNYRWDDVAKVPYLSYNPSGNSNDKFITYDNERSATEKVNYIKTKGIGGLIIWELGGGYRATRPLGQRDLLLQAIKTAAFGTAGGDTTPPLRSNGQPTGTLPIGTTQTTISLSTDETATCKYSLTPGITYNLMTNTFTTTGSISHSQLITGLTNGQSYTYYVKCQDTSGNANTDDFIISFNVGTSGGTFDYSLSNGGSRTVTQGSSTTQTITTTLTSGTTQSVSYSASNLPSGVTASFNPVSCNPTCSTTLTLTASPTAATGTSTITVTGTSGSLTRTTNFQLTVNPQSTSQYTLTVNKQGTGSGTVTSLPAGINCGGICSYNYDSGTSVTLTASPSTGSTFAGWSGACTGTSTCVVSMTQAMTVTATFNTQSSGGTANIYQDNLVSPWQSWSWGTTINWQSTTQVYEGSYSARVDYSAWGGFSPHISTAINPGSYNVLEFAIYPQTSSNFVFSVQLENDAGNNFPMIYPLTALPNTWTVFSLPMSQINQNNYPINRVNIQEQNGVSRTVYLDRIRFM